MYFNGDPSHGRQRTKRTKKHGFVQTHRFTIHKGCLSVTGATITMLPLPVRDRVVTHFSISAGTVEKNQTSIAIENQTDQSIEIHCF